jgi:hypothetical protein
MKRYYLGINGTRYTLVKTEVPSEELQGVFGKTYTAMIGPFRTKRGAVYMQTHPGCETVRNAERLAMTPWYPALNKWSDQTGYAHVLAKGDTARPLCGARPRGLGGGTIDVEETGTQKCPHCLKRLANMPPTITVDDVKRYHVKGAVVCPNPRKKTISVNGFPARPATPAALALAVCLWKETP